MGLGERLRRRFGSTPEPLESPELVISLWIDNALDEGAGWFELTRESRDEYRPALDIFPDPPEIRYVYCRFRCVVGERRLDDVLPGTYGEYLIDRIAARCGSMRATDGFSVGTFAHRRGNDNDEGDEVTIRVSLETDASGAPQRMAVQVGPLDVDAKLTPSSPILAPTHTPRRERVVAQRPSEPPTSDE